MPIHCNDVIMGQMASQITSLTLVYSTAYSGADQRRHQSSASLALVRGIHREPVNSPHKWPVTRKMFPFDDVIMTRKYSITRMSVPMQLPCQEQIKEYPAPRCNDQYVLEITFICEFLLTLHWRHNGRDSVSNHQPNECLLSRLIRRRSKKTSKLRVTGLCAGNSPETGEFPAQRASNAEMFPFDDVIMFSRFVASSYKSMSCYFFRWTGSESQRSLSSRKKVLITGTCFFFTDNVTIISSKLWISLSVVIYLPMVANYMMNIYNGSLCGNLKKICKFSC